MELNIAMEFNFCLSLLFALACGGLLEVEAYNKCNMRVVESIKHYWRGNYPSHILGNGLRDKDQVAVATTYNFLSEDVVCHHFTFDLELGYDPFVHSYVYDVYSNGTQSRSTRYYIEHEGTLFDPCSRTRVYNVHVSKKRVEGCYICTEDDNAPEGYPEGLVKIAASHGNTTTKEVEEAKDVLCRVCGVCAVFDYPTKCAPPTCGSY